MNIERKKWAVKAAGAGALALMMAVPSFAQSRDGRSSQRNDRGRTETRNESRSYRNNERVSAQGRVQSFSRERDGYRVQLDRGRDSYWVPQSYFRNRGRDLRVGVSVVLGGIFRGGSIYVDSVSWPDDRGSRGGYNDSYLTGVVQRVDLRRGEAEVREDRSGRVVRVDFRDTGHRSRLGVEDLRRGDYVELSGNWSGGGYFAVDSIEAIRDR